MLNQFKMTDRHFETISEEDAANTANEKNFWTEIEDKKLSELVEKFKEIYGMKHVSVLLKYKSIIS